MPPTGDQLILPFDVGWALHFIDEGEATMATAFYNLDSNPISQWHVSSPSFLRPQAKLSLYKPTLMMRDEENGFS